ncbi:DNA-directed RNA polymerase subunit beta [Bacillus solimangrovi]|uniref:Hydroxymyristoyl-ACP dehydratase n=1 Tax=Bacillus solimangrovi TaxID=1305675 RepID=A0A1E5LGZ3_9BACI|nr:DNA-directed RNA polymerase subunit beta [Bacillus solimangrovi]OEH93342.1 hypothetical protein BFG57_12525 [Bacillus solimangrovi]
MSEDIQLKSDPSKSINERNQGEMKEREQLINGEKRALRRRGVRLIPIWARVLIVLLLISLSLMSGLMVGYGVIGDGKATDALDRSTWTKVIDIVIKDTPSN